MKNIKFWKEFLMLAVSVVIAEMAGLIGSYFTMPAIGGWYATLQKPSFSPPNWVFAPVWTTLFFLMGVAFYLIWRQRANGKNIKTAVLVFFQQLALNVLWSALFFGLAKPGLAFGEIIVLWFAILMTIFYFAKISKKSGWLLAPYLVWVSFATVLNFFIWRMNM